MKAESERSNNIIRCKVVLDYLKSERDYLKDWSVFIVNHFQILHVLYTSLCQQPIIQFLFPFLLTPALIGWTCMASYFSWENWLQGASAVWELLILNSVSLIFRVISLKEDRCFLCFGQILCISNKNFFFRSRVKLEVGSHRDFLFFTIG